jgi:hypothetical protein
VTSVQTRASTGARTVIIPTDAAPAFTAKSGRHVIATPPAWGLVRQGQVLAGDGRAWVI